MRNRRTRGDSGAVGDIAAEADTDPDTDTATDTDPDPVTAAEPDSVTDPDPVSDAVAEATTPLPGVISGQPLITAMFCQLVGERLELGTRSPKNPH